MIRRRSCRSPQLLEGMGRRSLINEALRQQPHNTWFLLLRHVRCL